MTSRSLVDGDTLRLVAQLGPIPAVEARPITPTRLIGRAVLERRTIHVHDMQAALEEFPDAAAVIRAFGTRTSLVTPLVREGVAIGVIQIRRLEVEPFSAKQIALLESFADQAVIAIENVRLFTELQEKNQALTHAFAAYRDAFRDPAVIHATCEDYRAGATIDYLHDSQDQEKGRKISSRALGRSRCDEQARNVPRHLEALGRQGHRQWRWMRPFLAGGGSGRSSRASRTFPGARLIVTDQRGRLLVAALGFAGCSMPSYDRALHALRTWLDSWSGIGHVAVGMHRQGFDLQFTQYDERGWRATLYADTLWHSLVGS